MCIIIIVIIIIIESKCLSRTLVFCFFLLLIIAQNYFGDPWNVLDFIIVLGSIADIVYTELSVSHSFYRQSLKTKSQI